MRDAFTLHALWDPPNFLPEFFDTLLVSQVIFIPVPVAGDSLLWEYELPGYWDPDDDPVEITNVEFSTSGSDFISFQEGANKIVIIDIFSETV